MGHPAWMTFPHSSIAHLRRPWLCRPFFDLTTGYRGASPLGVEVVGFNPNLSWLASELSRRMARQNDRSRMADIPVRYMKAPSWLSVSSAEDTPHSWRAQ